MVSGILGLINKLEMDSQEDVDQMNPKMEGLTTENTSLKTALKQSREKQEQLQRLVQYL